MQMYTPIYQKLNLFYYICFPYSHLFKKKKKRRGKGEAETIEYMHNMLDTCRLSHDTS